MSFKSRFIAALAALVIAVGGSLIGLAVGQVGASSAPQVGFACYNGDPQAIVGGVGTESGSFASQICALGAPPGTPKGTHALLYFTAPKKGFKVAMGDALTAPAGVSYGPTFVWMEPIVTSDPQGNHPSPTGTHIFCPKVLPAHVTCQKLYWHL